MIPFITRHVFGLPRTRANQTLVRWKLRRLANLCAAIVGALFLAACLAWIAVMIFAL